MWPWLSEWSPEPAAGAAVLQRPSAWAVPPGQGFCVASFSGAGPASRCGSGLLWVSVSSTVKQTIKKKKHVYMILGRFSQVRKCAGCISNLGHWAKVKKGGRERERNTGEHGWVPAALALHSTSGIHGSHERLATPSGILTFKVLDYFSSQFKRCAR